MMRVGGPLILKQGQDDMTFERDQTGSSPLQTESNIEKAAPPLAGRKIWMPKQEVTE